jgi:hypothetical protein
MDTLGRFGQGHMRPAEVVEHGMQGDGVGVILDLFGEGVGQPGKPPHAHPHGQVLALHERSGNVRRVRVFVHFTEGIDKLVIAFCLPLLTGILGYLFGASGQQQSD